MLIQVLYIQPVSIQHILNQLILNQPVSIQLILNQLVSILHFKFIIRRLLTVKKVNWIVERQNKQKCINKKLQKELFPLQKLKSLKIWFTFKSMIFLILEIALNKKKK